MEITVTIPPSVEDHLRTYAASLFYETSPYAISRAIVCALINQLDAACLVSRDEIVTGILEASKPVASKPLPPLVVEHSVVELPVLELPVVELPVAETPPVKQETPLPTKKSRKESAIAVLTDPKKLKVPGENFKGGASNTWLVWGWSMASSLNLVTLESGSRKFHSFNLQDVIQGVVQRKGVRIQDTTAYSALDAMVKRQWLNFNSTAKVYTLSPVAQKWALTAKNQIYLIEKGFLDPVPQSEMITK